MSDYIHNNAVNKDYSPSNSMGNSTNSLQEPDYIIMPKQVHQTPEVQIKQKKEVEHKNEHQNVLYSNEYLTTLLTELPNSKKSKKKNKKLKSKNKIPFTNKVVHNTLNSQSRVISKLSNSVGELPRQKKFPASFAKFPMFSKKHQLSKDKLIQNGQRKNILCVWKSNKSKERNTSEMSLIEVSGDQTPQRKPQVYNSYENIMQSKKNYEDNFFQILHKNMKVKDKKSAQIKGSQDSNTVVISKDNTISRISNSKPIRELPIVSLGGLFDLAEVNKNLKNTRKFDTVVNEKTDVPKKPSTDQQVKKSQGSSHLDNQKIFVVKNPDKDLTEEEEEMVFLKSKYNNRSIRSRKSTRRSKIKRVQTGRKSRKNENSSRDHIYNLRDDILISRFQRGQSNNENQPYVSVNLISSEDGKEIPSPAKFMKHKFEISSSDEHHKIKSLNLMMGNRCVKKARLRRRSSKLQINTVNEENHPRSPNEPRLIDVEKVYRNFSKQKITRRLEQNHSYEPASKYENYEKIKLEGCLISSKNNIKVKDRIFHQIDMEKLKNDISVKDPHKVSEHSSRGTLRQYKLYQNIQQEFEKLSGKTKDAYSKKDTRNQGMWFNNQLTEMNSQRLNIKSSADNIRSRKMLYHSGRVFQAKTILQKILGIPNS
ncbi:unnamed protein product [Moneuplotes crassus]|uniref:Uncharacterized protein n=1 Tax=Euplotes crassus TaxID=5936 RepID=A0AAD2DAX9_EUPCR|nr:unnamed protein product [Moneuplotes crassus]